MKIEVFKDARKEWRWRMKARNGRIIAVSGEGYKNKSYCLDMAWRFSRAFESIGEQIVEVIEIKEKKNVRT